MRFRAILNGAMAITALAGGLSLATPARAQTSSVRPLTGISVRPFPGMGTTGLGARAEVNFENNPLALLGIGPFGGAETRVGVSPGVLGGLGTNPLAAGPIFAPGLRTLMATSVRPLAALQMRAAVNFDNNPLAALGIGPFGGVGPGGDLAVLGGLGETFVGPRFSGFFVPGINPFFRTPFGVTPTGFNPFFGTPFGITPTGFNPFFRTPFGITPTGFNPFFRTPFGVTPTGFNPFFFRR